MTEDLAGYKVRFKVVTTSREATLRVYRAIAAILRTTLEEAKKKGDFAGVVLHAWELDPPALLYEREKVLKEQAAADLTGLPTFVDDPDVGLDAIKVSFPLPPDTVNPRRQGHWSTTHAKKKHYHELVARVLEEQFPDGVPAFKAADYRAHFYVAGRHDRDNITALLKLPTDALVRAGFVPNDSEKFLRLVDIPEQTVVTVRRRKNEPDDVFWERKEAARLQHRLEVLIWPRT